MEEINKRKILVIGDNSDSNHLAIQKALDLNQNEMIFIDPNSAIENIEKIIELDENQNNIIIGNEINNLTNFQDMLANDSLNELKKLAQYEYLRIPAHNELKAYDLLYSDLTKKEREAVIIPVRTKEKIGRNALCPCGSGLKYKKCCRNKEI